MADKGFVTVTPNKIDYVEKSKLMLSYESKYSKINKNPLDDLKKTIKKLCHDWNNMGYFHTKYS